MSFACIRCALAESAWESVLEFALFVLFMPLHKFDNGVALVESAWESVLEFALFVLFIPLHKFGYEMPCLFVSCLYMT